MVGIFETTAHASLFGTLIRIKRMTCGLRTVPDPTSDNLNPQETTTQEVGEMGLDGGGLSCPGSSVVADDPE